MIHHLTSSIVITVKSHIKTKSGGHKSAVTLNVLCGLSSLPAPGKMIRHHLTPWQDALWWTKSTLNSWSSYCTLNTRSPGLTTCKCKQRRRHHNLTGRGSTVWSTVESTVWSTVKSTVRSAVLSPHSSQNSTQFTWSDTLAPTIASASVSAEVHLKFKSGKWSWKSTHAR